MPDVEARLAQFDADLMVVCDYGQILSPATLGTTRHGGVNLHASLLPKYRGAAPINWAIYNGDAETGVTVLNMTPQIDAGGCLAQTGWRSVRTKRRRNSKSDWRASALGSICDTIDRWNPAACRPSRKTLAGHEGPAPEKDRRGNRLVPPGVGDQEPDSRDGAVAEDLHILASR